MHLSEVTFGRNGVAMKLKFFNSFFEWVLSNKLAALSVGFLYLLLPPTGKGLSSTKDWNDQNLFWQGVINLQEKNDSSWSHDGWVGPGYVGLVRVVSRVFAIDATNAMVLTNRLCFAVAGVFIALIIQLFLRHSFLSEENKKRVLLASVIGFAFIPVFTYSDIPWTNFLTYVIWTLSLYLLFHLKMQSSSDAVKLLIIFTVGFLSFFARQVREADGLILIIFGLIFVSLKLVPDLKSNLITKIYVLKCFVAYFFGILFSWISVGILSANFTIFSQYWKVEEIFPGFKSLYTTGILSRFIGVFVDPCYNSYCPDNSYTGLLDDLSRIWAQPILLQIASLGPAVLLVFFITVKLMIHTKLNLNLLYFFLLVGTGTTFILGYTSLTVLNGSVIKFGTSREFFLPTMLLIVAFVYFLTTHSHSRFNLRFLVIAFNVLTLLMVTLALTIGLPRFENHHVEKVTTTINTNECKESSKCLVRMKILGANAREKQFSTKGWVEAIYKPDFVENNNIKTTGISIQEVIPGKQADVYRKWYQMSKNGILPKEILKGIKSDGVFKLHFVPIYLGVQGTPTHTKHIDELTLIFNK